MRQTMAVMLMFALSIPGLVRAEATAEQPAVIGVLFYADWCGSCQVLDPVIEKARGKSDLDNQPVLFVRLDLTNATSRYQAGLLAESLGLGAIYNKNAGATGYMLLLDADTKAPVARLTKSMDANEITASIKAAIDSAG